MNLINQIMDLIGEIAKFEVNWGHNCKQIKVQGLTCKRRQN
jgi:hypothetical protein